MNSWFSSKSSRHRTPPARDDAQSGPTNTSSVSQSTVGPVQTLGNLTSVSDVPLDEVHAHINDTTAYAHTPSLIHSAGKDTGTFRTSDVPPASSLDATTYRPERDSAQRVSYLPKRPERTLFTPQDAIVAQVFGKSAPPATNPVHATSPPPLNVPQPSVSLTTSDSVHTPPSIPSSRTQSGPVLTIYDPFSGAKLGEHTPISPSTVTPGDQSASAPVLTADDRKLWSSLERILELQAEIAAMHADMEGVGGRATGSNAHTGTVATVATGEAGNVGPRKRSKRGHTLPIGDEEPEEHEPEGGIAGIAISEISVDHSDGEDDDEDDEDEDDVHVYGKKRRDEEFAKVAEQFAQRKAAIGGIMNKLDALSTALKTFHTLPPPLFDLAASPPRTDAVSPASSNVSSPSPPPPFHVYPARPLSLSPVSSPQAGKPATPPIVPLSPSVPPISTVALPVSSGDPNALSGHTSIVAPALPRMALPMIIPGASHVESPADMDHAQSTFKMVP